MFRGRSRWGERHQSFWRINSRKAWCLESGKALQTQRKTYYCLHKKEMEKARKLFLYRTRCFAWVFRCSTQNSTSILLGRCRLLWLQRFPKIPPPLTWNTMDEITFTKQEQSSPPEWPFQCKESCCHQLIILCLHKNTYVIFDCLSLWPVKYLVLAASSRAQHTLGSTIFISFLNWQTY